MKEKEKQCEYQDFIFFANIMFKTLGYDFLDSARPSWQKVFLRCYFFLCIACNCYEASFVALRIIQWESVAGSPSKIMRQALHFFYMLSAEVKFVTLIIYRKRLRTLILGLQELYPTDDSLRREYEVNRYCLPRATRYVLYFYYFVMALMALGPLLQSFTMYFLQGNDAKFLFLRIFPTRLSFHVDTPKGYAVAYIMDFTYSQFIVNVSLGTDLWMMCVSNQICMHFGYLAKKLAAYLPSRERERADCEFLCSFVQKHQQILRLHKEVNQVFGLLLASNLFTTASLLCCMAFYTVVQGLNAEGISYMMLFASVAAQFYMVSSYGQRLIDLSFSISMAAYLQNWYDGSIRYKKDLLLIMARAERPAEISAKGIIVISLDTFKILMSITYRFFAVIRQTVGK
ncbi:GL11094 [Drosophila persimilis]|uniref:Odorant receptor n=1 Tax=Drosophila persimilis TaxID=7234 RepID=B4GBX4_DROPE|nr:GL11094 [Drosophila persimilis]